MGKRIVQVGFGFQILYFVFLLIDLIVLFVSEYGSSLLFSLVGDPQLYYQLQYLPIMVITAATAIGFAICFFETHSIPDLAVSCIYALYVVAAAFLFCGNGSPWLCCLLIAAEILVSVCLSVRFFHREKWMVAAIIVTAVLPVLLYVYFVLMTDSILLRESYGIFFGMPGFGNLATGFPWMSGIWVYLFYGCALLLPQLMSAVLRLVSVSVKQEK